MGVPREWGLVLAGLDGSLEAACSEAVSPRSPSAGLAPQLFCHAWSSTWLCRKLSSQPRAESQTSCSVSSGTLGVLSQQQETGNRQSHLGSRSLKPEPKIRKSRASAGGRQGKGSSRQWARGHPGSARSLRMDRSLGNEARAVATWRCLGCVLGGEQWRSPLWGGAVRVSSAVGGAGVGRAGSWRQKGCVEAGDGGLSQGSKRAGD